MTWLKQKSNGEFARRSTSPGRHHRKKTLTMMCPLAFSTSRLHLHKCDKRAWVLSSSESWKTENPSVVDVTGYSALTQISGVLNI
jgi:hypothetical protein